MAANVEIFEGDKVSIYEQLILQIEQICISETNFIANIGNCCAILKSQFDWHWVGCYFIDQKVNNLVLGPFQGPLACTRIAYGKGVCGTAWENNEIVIVPNVHEFPGHIACSAASNSEIVLPMYDVNNTIIGVFDIDSIAFDAFDAIDAKYLSKMLQIITNATV